MNSGAFENIAHKDENGNPRRACGKTAAARLGDVCESAASNLLQKDLEGRTGGYAVYGAGGFIKNVDFYHRSRPYIAVVKDGAGVGRVMKLPAKTSVIGTMQYVLPKTGVDINYLAYAMEFMNLGKYCSGATIPHIYFKDYKNENLNLPPLDEQRRIASLLDKISELAAKRRRQLDKLDELVKSRFVEMFGNFMDSHDDKVTLADVCKIITDGTHQPPKFVSSGIPFLFVSNIVTNEITYEAEKFISEDTYQELIKRTPVEPGDILLSTVCSYGHPAIVKSDKPFCFQRHIAYLKPKSDLVDNVYLYSAILSDDVQRQIEKSVKGIAQKTLNLSEIRKIKMPLPSLDLQRRFSETVGHIDKIKFKVHASLEKLETLKKSKMQEFFGNAG